MSHPVLAALAAVLCRYGENLMSVASQVPMENSCSKASEGWYNEIKDYSFDYSRYPPWTQQWPSKKIGHFTAVSTALSLAQH